jgi:hypothetical protein
MGGVRRVSVERLLSLDIRYRKQLQEASRDARRLSAVRSRDKPIDGTFARAEVEAQ